MFSINVRSQSQELEEAMASENLSMEIRWFLRGNRMQSWSIFANRYSDLNVI